MAGVLTDAAGNRHRRADGPCRIVSLVPSLTECLCELGLAGQLVGRTGFCIQPREALRDVPKVGGTKDVDLQRIRALQPTHVVLNIDENRRETADALARFVPRLVVTHPRAPRDNFALYELLGGIFAREDAAARLAGALQAELDRLDAAPALPERRVLYLIWRDPWMTVGPDTYIARMLSLVNWRNVTVDSEQRYPALQLEKLRGRVDLVLLSSEPYPFRDRHAGELRAALPGAAVRLVRGDMLSWYGSRAAAASPTCASSQNSLPPAPKLVTVCNYLTDTTGALPAWNSTPSNSSARARWRPSGCTGRMPPIH